MLQFDLQFYEELTVAWVRTVKFISGAFFWPTGQLVYLLFSAGYRSKITACGLVFVPVCRVTLADLLNAH